MTAGCGSSDSGNNGSNGSSGAAAGSETIGGDGSPCPLPVTFKLPDGWKAQSVSTEGADAFGIADVELACELDAKPAGMLGFIRVFVGDTSKPSEDVLKAFVAKYKGKGTGDSAEKYTATKIGGADGSEVSYVSWPVDGDSKKEAAFAVKPGAKTVLVHVGGLDNEEHESMLPGFKLVKESLTAR
nr:lipoprotein [Kibdelosporangium phytohabitans]